MTSIAILVIYVIIAAFVAICYGVKLAMVERGKLYLEDLVWVLITSIFWPGVAIALGFFGIGFLFKMLCEKIAQAILHFKTRTPSKVGLENTIKKL